MQTDNKKPLFLENIYQKSFIFFMAFLCVYYLYRNMPLAGIDYKLVSLLIDYRFGFIKRGLLPEILTILNINKFIFLNVMTFGGCFILASWCLWQYKDRLHQNETFIYLTMYLFAPFFIKNYMFDAGRVDILCILFLPLLASCTKRSMLLVFYLYPALFFIHEGIALIFLPFALYIFHIKSENPLKNIHIALLLAISFSSLILIAVVGSPDIPITHMNDFVQLEFKSYFSNYISSVDAHKFLYYSTKENFLFALGEVNIRTLCNFIIMCILLCPIILNFHQTFKHDKIYKISVVFWMLIPTLFLCLMASDRGRFFANCFSAMFLCCIVKDKDFFITNMKAIFSKFYASQYIYWLLMLSLPYLGIYFNPLGAKPKFDHIRICMPYISIQKHPLGLSFYECSDR
jgi:hypothetical protein